MAQILDPLPPERTTGHIVCCYVNATSQIQIARITNIPNWYFERVVFPGQRLIFEALPEAILEIHTGMMASAILSDKIPCARLCMEEDVNTCDIIILAQPSEEKEEKIDIKQSLEVANKKIREIPKPLTTATVG